MEAQSKEPNVRARQQHAHAHKYTRKHTNERQHASCVRYSHRCIHRMPHRKIMLYRLVGLRVLCAHCVYEYLKWRLCVSNVSKSDRNEQINSKSIHNETGSEHTTRRHIVCTRVLDRDNCMLTIFRVLQIACICVPGCRLPSHFFANMVLPSFSVVYIWFFLYVDREYVFFWTNVAPFFVRCVKSYMYGMTTNSFRCGKLKTTAKRTWTPSLQSAKTSRSHESNVRR